MFTDSDITRVRDSVDIVELVSGYVSLKKTGKNWTGLCPFHSEKTPSFSVNPDKQIFHCFGCGVGGDAFKFVELQEGLNFPEAVRRLAERSGVALPDRRERGAEQKSGDEKKALLSVMADAAEHFRRELEAPGGSAARAYLAKRGVSEQVVKDFGLGYSRPEWDGLLKVLRQKGHQPALLEKAGLIIKRSEGEGHYDRFRGRIIFPIRDLSGTVIAFGGRVMDDSLPKYLNSPETPLYSKSNVLYCLDQAKEPGRKQGYFIIVEGYLDALACHQYGAKNTVATLGTALTEGHLRLMRRFAQKLVLIFDPDPAGVRAALRGFELFAGSGMKVNVVSLPGGDDPDTFLKKNGYEAFVACLKDSLKFMDFVLAQVVKDGRGLSIDLKVERAAEMLGFIARLPSGLERDHYLKKTAEALDVDEALLRQEPALKRPAATERPGRREAAPGPRPARSVRRPKAEEMLIHLMLKDADAARLAREEIRPEDFTDPLCRRAAESIFNLMARTGGLDSAALLNESDEELRTFLSHFSVLEATYEENCRDCVACIKQGNHERKIKELDRAIRDAETRGDAAGLRRLLEEQTRLSKKQGRRIPGL